MKFIDFSSISEIFDRLIMQFTFLLTLLHVFDCFFE